MSREPESLSEREVRFDAREERSIERSVFKAENPFLCQKAESGFPKCKNQCDACEVANDKLLK